jgi:F-type H+-transporting ATPase subunit epsilon
MAIPKHLQLLFVTPDRALAQEDVDEVELPGEEGYFGVLPGHAPMLAALRTGEMWYRKGTQKHYAFIDGGFAEVLPDRVSIMAQVAERAEDIDLARAEASKRRAEDLLARPAAAADVESTRTALQRAVTRLDVSRHSRARH